MTKTLICGIVGMKYHEGAMDRLQELQDRDHLVLVREPENPHDPNAVAVKDVEDFMLGYIPRGQAVFAAELLDNDQVEEVYFVSATDSVALVYERPEQEEQDPLPQGHSEGSGI